ncbi:MAG: hypothetical protein KAH16_02120 [Candidatus Izimaplasma sp.]|nr:hypothetical protein [Candidatus Izimaplasma bacterium]
MDIKISKEQLKAFRELAEQNEGALKRAVDSVSKRDIERAENAYKNPIIRQFLDSEEGVQRNKKELIKQKIQELSI